MNCEPLIKAIDTYILKADNSLSDELSEQGYAKPKKTIKYMQDIEDGVTEALLEETDYFITEAEKAVDLETFAKDVWPQIKLMTRSKGNLLLYLRKAFTSLCRSLLAII